jgi:hypothetical protein
MFIQVFIPEQIAYNKADLDRHMRSGDLAGPLAESGFKGHPQCRFCHKRFYGDNELFIHMQSAHEQCFICRRARPDRYIYYRDYNELEGKKHLKYACAGLIICTCSNLCTKQLTTLKFPSSSSGDVQ